MKIDRDFWNNDYATENNLYDYCEDESYDKRMEIHIYPHYRSYYAKYDCGVITDLKIEITEVNFISDDVEITTIDSELVDFDFQQEKEAINKAFEIAENFKNKYFKPENKDEKIKRQKK